VQDPTEGSVNKSGANLERGLAEDDEPIALNQQLSQLIDQWKYQEAIPVAERALEVAKRARGPEHPEAAAALNNLGFLFQKIGDYPKAEPLLQETLRSHLSQPNRFISFFMATVNSSPQRSLQTWKITSLPSFFAGESLVTT